MITLADYFMGRDRIYPDELTDEIKSHAAEVVAKANLLLSVFREKTGDTDKRNVNSGWRPAGINAATPGAAPRSKHMSAQAVDIADPEGDLDAWCMENQEMLADVGLWLEHPSATKGWTHWQIVPPKSGKRVFYP